jgi:hypothetical protein
MEDKTLSDDGHGTTIDGVPECPSPRYAGA